MEKSYPAAGENKRKHLELIQGVVNRLAGNSFAIKGWTAALVAAIFGLAVASSNRNPSLFNIAFIPVLPLWILDAYFLWQERLYRVLYGHIREKNEEEIDYDMNATPFEGGRNTMFNSFISFTLVIFYFSLISTVVVVILTLPGKVN